MKHSQSRSKIVRADLMLLLVVAIWGTTFPVMKQALNNIGPFYFIAWRFIIAFIAISLLFRRQLGRIGRTTLKKGLILGSCLFGGYAFQIVGLQYTTASRSGFITGLSVVLVPILAVFILKETPDRLAWVGVGLALLGLFFLTGTGSSQTNFGDLLTLFCALSIALQITLLSRYLGGESPIVLTWLQLGVVGFGGLVFALIRGEFTSITLQTAGVAFYTGLFASALAYLVQSHAQQYTTPTHTGLIFTLEPVFAALFAYIMLGEVIGLNGVFGGVLILMGMLISEYRALPGSEGS